MSLQQLHKGFSKNMYLFQKAATFQDKYIFNIFFLIISSITYHYLSVLNNLTSDFLGYMFGVSQVYVYTPEGSVIVFKGIFYCVVKLYRTFFIKCTCQ